MCQRFFATGSRVLAAAVLLAGVVHGSDRQETPGANVDARDLVHQSLSSEMDGDNHQRRCMLAKALEIAPSLPPANWHSGRLRVDGQWRSIAHAQKQAAGDEKLARYRQMRERANAAPSRLVVLARWCAREGLEELSKLHFRQLLANPATDAKSRKEAMRKLGLRDYGGALLTEEEIKQRRELAKHMEVAMKHWRPRLATWQKALESASRKRREYAMQQMEKIDDPYVIPVVETLISVSGQPFGGQVIALLGRFHEYEATEALVRYALLAPPPSVRDAAVGELKKRSLHDFVPILLGGLASPIQSKWRVLWDAGGSVRYQHAFFRDGQTANQMLATDHLAVARDTLAGEEITNRNSVPAGPGATKRFRGLRSAGRDVDRGLQAGVALEAMANAAQRERQVAMANTLIQNSNAQVYHVLEQISGAELPRNPADWWYWWEEYNESVKPKPTGYAYLPSTSSYGRPVVAQYDRQAPPSTPSPTASARTWRLRPRSSHSCFVAGTQVWTETGRLAIEQVQVGDRVLAQSPNTGELALKLVQHVTAGDAASELAEVTIDGQSIYPTLGHVMWVNGKGWRIAKRLNPGDRVHGVSGAVVVDSIQEMPSPPVVHNLIVEDFHTYFVGENGILVHDITYRQPTRALVPGLLDESVIREKVSGSFSGKGS